MKGNGVATKWCLKCVNIMCRKWCGIMTYDAGGCSQLAHRDGIQDKIIKDI